MLQDVVGWRHLSADGAGTAMSSDGSAPTVGKSSSDEIAIGLRKPSGQEGMETVDFGNDKPSGALFQKADGSGDQWLSGLASKGRTFG